MTTVRHLLDSIADRLHTSASAATVYGDPVEAEGKTIISVAKVRYGFGAGGGEGVSEESEDSADKEGFGGGGGGGVEITPMGFIEITAGETRYVSLDERQRIVKILAVAVIIGLFMLRRKRRRR
ncbi:MAG: hypothetical protein FI707_03005 [SAR202 cluster bacterium]|nr:hypothetical protein [SAR202 cluster bacterium]MQG67742.1 hypothetical protein [SAR202 cluster bacterium]HAL48293.1 hypothetical protein [Dehalococcoidia bacterium]